MTRRSTWVFAGALGLVLAIAAVLWIWQSTNRPASAQDTALAYLHALESGDAEALAAVSAAVPKTAVAVFEAADEHIQEPALTSVDDGGETAAVAASFVLVGEQHTASFSLSQVDGRWKVDRSALGTVRAAASAGGFVAVGATTFAVGEEFDLFPAAYTITAAPRELLDGEAAVTVLPGASVAAALDVTLLPAATAAAQAALDEHLARCTTGGEDVVPSGCGIRIPWGTEFREIDDVRYRIDSSPVLTLGPTGFDTTSGVLIATVTGVGQNGQTRTTTYRTESWNLRGDVAFTETGVELSAW